MGLVAPLLDRVEVELIHDLGKSPFPPGTSQKTPHLPATTAAT